MTFILHIYIQDSITAIYEPYLMSLLDVDKNGV